MKTLLCSTLLCSLFFGVGAAETRAADLRLPAKHPLALFTKPSCTECHAAETTVAGRPVALYNHDGPWTAIHRYYAAKDIRVCETCHAASFCTECHAYKDELKPSDKNSDRPERWYPHRGDYLFQHRIDGKVDPTACFRCHGRQNNHVCRRCHR